ncbi:citrate lyase holo-[acyl-carrier protein] synthase [Clostridium polynesiense]|uniref:citrate lyase holo-[acyl-carrier protein] synthase n=1 Tax=Clostridium polynesiense TaxID=1325933 RepID=UPI00058D3D35|nr:citrate lyase holo-[acyl-carrier protein] synthase [Clostridium polynesiense]
MRYTAEDILNEREKRVIFQQNLMLIHKKPLVFIRANFPGVNKDNSLTEKIIKVIDKCVTDIFSRDIVIKIHRITAEGPNTVLIINKELIDIKSLTLQIEDKHPLGRFVDIDVYNPHTFMSISRTSLGYDPRECYICSDLAHNCIREGRHDINTIIDFINKSYINYSRSFYERK